jgi:protein-S-isoprenylcysteine O-methyltransferase Ste14
MNAPAAPVVAMCLANLALIGMLPRIFFRRGSLNFSWWLTAAPFLVAPAVLVGSLFGLLTPALPGSELRDTMAILLGAISVGFIGYTLGSHREPVSLWYQPDDSPERLVTHGAYARVRHPFYAAFLVALLAAFLAVPHWATLGALAYAAFRLNRTAALEEDRLLASFLGVTYAAYMRNTGRFVPRLRRRPPASPPGGADRPPGDGYPDRAGGPARRMWPASATRDPTPSFPKTFER